MKIDFILKNYRCFSDECPARFQLRDGFVSFVGPNNSGKSSLLKFFYEFRNLFNSFADFSWIHSSLVGEASFSWNNSILDNNEVFCNGNDRDLLIEMSSQDMLNSNPPPPSRILITIRRGTHTCRLTLTTADGDSIQGAVHIGDDAVLTHESRKTSLAPLQRMCGDLTRTLYLGPFRNAINIGSNENYFDMRVGASFIDTWRNYKTGSLKEANEAAYRVTEEIKHIFGFRDLQIDSSFDGRTLQLLINGRSFKLPEVGSGLTEFILVLINATIQNPSFIFIDEPESHLHPSLQLDFLSTLAAHAAYGVVFATHSIGLARASSDTVYTVRRNETLSEVRPLESTPRLAEFSGELGFFSYKQLGFDQLLLVEGPTEVRTFHQFLRMVKKDHEIVVLPLGGSSLINAERELELSEIKRITDRVYAVIDSEKPGPDEAVPDDRQQFKSLCEKLRITCRILDRRAIENYLSDQAIKTIKGDKYSALTSYERLKDCAMPWAKSENWRIAREMVFDEIKNTDLGEFLRSL